MKIIIPMAGSGQRFIDAGFALPKPLIKIGNKPIIEYITEKYPPDSEFIFICNEEHIGTTELKKVLEDMAINTRIVAIEMHKKGPVYSVLQAGEFIKDEEEVIVNYCDFNWEWDYEGFNRMVGGNGCDGCVTAYKGFHPHLLGSDLYASMRVDKNNWMLECREKHSFTENKMNSFQQAGTFYFSKGSILKKYCGEVIRNNIEVNGEYYFSNVAQAMREDNLKIYVYPLQYFLQWGTPQDMEEYVYWSETFKSKTKKHFRYDKTVSDNLTLLVPMAGEGSRFQKEGYKIPKPLIEVSGKPMIVQAVNDLPQAHNHVFLCRKEHIEQHKLDKTLKDIYPDTKTIKVDKLTEGQACTCLLAENNVDMENPLLIGACDNGMLWDMNKFASLVSDPKVSALIITFRNNSTVKRNPKAYGWVRADKEGNVIGVSCKIPISDNPLNDHAIVGSFYFKKAKYFFEGAKQMIKKNIRINNEFYVDTVFNELVENGLGVKVFEIDKYVCWGAPDDLRIYNYWQEYFDKGQHHPYKKELDEDFNELK